MDKFAWRLGIQHQWEEGYATRLTWGLGGFAGNGKTDGKLRRFDLSGSMRLDEAAVETFTASALFDLRANGQVQASARRFQPTDEPISFRERFHELLSNTEQTSARVVWRPLLRPRWEAAVEARGSRFGSGDSGTGVAVGVDYDSARDWRYDARFDYFSMDDERTISLYARLRRPLTAFMEAQFEAVQQWKETTLSGDNRLSGVAFRLHRLVAKRWVAKFFGEYLHHSERDNEYRLGIGVRYTLLRLATEW